VRFLTDKELAAEKTVNIGKKRVDQRCTLADKAACSGALPERLRTKLVRI